MYGQELTIRTDHRPLLGLMKKPMAHLSMHQQRFVAHSMRYSFKLEYLPRKELFVVDYLLRAAGKEGPECSCKMMGTDIRLKEAFVSMVLTVPNSNL